MEETYTISHIVRNGVHVKGDTTSYEFLTKLVRKYNIPPDGKSIKNKPEYKISTLEKYYDLYKTESDGDGNEMAELRKRKLEMEIEQLSKDITKRDLQIEQLENTLIDSQEVANFLVARRSIELAILRRILFVQLPIEIPGTSIPKAREKAGHYYNELVSTYEEAERIWSEKYELSDTKELEKKLEQLIYKTQQTSISGSQSNKPETITADSGSANHPVV